MFTQSRRAFVGGLLSSAFAQAATAKTAPARVPPDVAALYGPIEGDRFPIPAAPLSRINPAFLRAHVDYQGTEEPGTVVVDPNARYLYLVQDGGRAIRYGVGVGREGFGWSGTATVHNKQEWPDWYPPKEMIAREPKLRRALSHLQSGVGMPGGPRNPLGARAMYLWQDGKDTLYRIHGTVEPWTIGKHASSGCIRMINQDAIDLYGRVPVGTTVVVLGRGEDVVASGEPTRRRPRRHPMRIDPNDQGAYGPGPAPDPYGQGGPYGGGYNPYAHRGPNGYDPYRGYYGGGHPRPYNQPWMGDGDM